MNSVQIAEVSAAPASVVHMSKMIQVRNVPDEMHRALKMRSVEEGMTLSDFIKRELSVIATEKSSLDEIDARLKARGPSGLRTETIVKLIREGRGE
jgi:plasmid stability protein